MHVRFPVSDEAKGLESDGEFVCLRCMNNESCPNGRPMLDVPREILLRPRSVSGYLDREQKCAFVTQDHGVFCCQDCAGRFTWD
jgi:hypothetical protein